MVQPPIFSTVRFRRKVKIPASSAATNRIVSSGTVGGDGCLKHVKILYMYR